MNKKVNAKRIASAKFRKAKNKEIALANNLFLAFPAGIEPTVYRLGGSVMKMTLKDTCEFYSGTGFPTVYQGSASGKYPFYKVGDISKNVQQGYKFLEICDNYIDDDILKQIKGVLIPKNSIAFAKIGEALKLNRRAITKQDCLVDNNFVYSI